MPTLLFLPHKYVLHLLLVSRTEYSTRFVSAPNRQRQLSAWRRTSSTGRVRVQIDRSNLTMDSQSAVTMEAGLFCWCALDRRGRGEAVRSCGSVADDEGYDGRRGLVARCSGRIRDDGSWIGRSCGGCRVDWWIRNREGSRG